MLLLDTRLCHHKAMHIRFSFILLVLNAYPRKIFITLYPPSMVTRKPLLLSAILQSKYEITIITLLSTDICPDIEVDGDIEDGKWRSKHFVRLYVDNNEVAKSTKEPTSSVLKWEWNADNQM